MNKINRWKKFLSEPKTPQPAALMGLSLLCMILIWFVPGFLEPGLFLSGSDHPGPYLKQVWFIPDGSGTAGYPLSTVHTTEGDYHIDGDIVIRPIPSFSVHAATAAHAVYTREETGEEYVVGQWWYTDEEAFRDEKKVFLRSLAERGEVSPVMLDLGDHLSTAAAEQACPALRFTNGTVTGYILTYERPFDNGDDFFIVYYGTCGNVLGPDPKGSLQALIAERFSPSAVRPPGEDPEPAVRMPDASALGMIRYAGVLILTPLLFGCAAALLFQGVRIEVQAGSRRLLILFAGLALLYLVLASLMGVSTRMDLPNFLPGSLLSLPTFLSGLTLLCLAAVTPFLLLTRHLPLRRPIPAVVVSGTLLFPYLVVLVLWTDPLHLPLPPSLALLVSTLRGVGIAAAGAAVLFVGWAAVERIRT
ncbi:hypothetical protein E2N92_00580 [Methanofollis formosanus]|uniref:Uncharacterized protein n=1 Tax=Methanofollis formosanus TaxID=299308 RepID=A0A8G1EFC6_9EURY|nr:hypothetical protein [Methanofollis formosanus]QYZ78029.1 hypothetical protein E2N92_00580 [Methanofollis formosanus]